MTSAAAPPATRPNPTVRLRQYRHYHRDLRPYALALPRETVGPRKLPLMRRLAARTRPHPAAVVTDLGDGARVRVFGDTGRRVPGPALLWIHGGGYVFGTAAGRLTAACAPTWCWMPWRWRCGLESTPGIPSVPGRCITRMPAAWKSGRQRWTFR
jgi:hypothetical protein